MNRQMWDRLQNLNVPESFYGASGQKLFEISYVDNNGVVTGDFFKIKLESKVNGVNKVGDFLTDYYKAIQIVDTNNFEDMSWQLMTQVSNGNVYSQSKTNLIEFEWAPGTLNKADNFISYTSTNGQKYSSFSQFAIKVVISSSDSTIVPIITDIRALALPSGTGL
jgi:hypothetical protein